MPHTSQAKSLCSLLAALFLVGCGAVPVVSITSPADGTTVREDVQLVLAATASDAEDGDLTSGITWSSDLAGALTPDDQGRVSLSPGTHVLTASVTDAKENVGRASVTVTVTALPSGSHVVGEGRNLHYYAVTGDEVIERAVAEVPGAGLLAGHHIFNVVQHPSQPWLYVASFNECGIGDFWCWGNARIDRFVVTASTLTHAGAAFLYVPITDGPTCAEEDSGYEGQIGECAPIGMVFNADATRLYVDDDELDGIHVFSVDGSGTLTFLAESGDTSDHGLALSANGQYLYNGPTVLEITGNDTAVISDTSTGNATQLVNTAGGLRLATTLSTDTVAVYSLADPAAPTLIDEHEVGSNFARDLAINAGFTRFVTVGENRVTTLAFTSDTFTIENDLVLTETTPIQNRGVELAANDTRAVVAWFQNNEDNTNGGVTVYNISDTGQLSSSFTATYERGARVVRKVRLP